MQFTDIFGQMKNVAITASQIERALNNQIMILESAEPRDVHHFATLLGYGAQAINPYLAQECVAELVTVGLLDKDPGAAVNDYDSAILHGIVKIASKMGISTIQSYQSAQIFECVGINRSVIGKYFTNTTSRVEGVGLTEIGEGVEWNHNQAFDPLGLGYDTTLDSTGAHKLRSGPDKEDHMVKSYHRIWQRRWREQTALQRLCHFLRVYFGHKQEERKMSAINTLWVLLGATLVFFMIPGGAADGSGGTISLADVHEAILMTYVFSDGDSGVTLYSKAVNNIALANDAAVQFRLVTSVESAENSLSRSALLLYSLKNPYVGDMVADGKLLSALNVADLGAYKLELFTSRQPYVLQINFQNEPEDPYALNNAMTFNLVTPIRFNPSPSIRTDPTTVISSIVCPCCSRGAISPARHAMLPCITNTAPAASKTPIPREEAKIIEETKSKTALVNSISWFPDSPSFNAPTIVMSCPQACIIPGVSLAKGSPVSSYTGSASMSARRATHLPGPAVPCMASIL